MARTDTTSESYEAATTVHRGMSLLQSVCEHFIHQIAGIDFTVVVGEDQIQEWQTGSLHSVVRSRRDRGWAQLDRSQRIYDTN